MEVKITRKADLRYRLREITDDAGRKAVREAIGLELTSMAKQAFDSPSMRPYAWQKRVSGGTHPLLKKTGTLQRSITMEAGTRSVTLASSAIYAAVHQFGATIRAKGGGRLAFKLPGGGFARPEQVKIPARPFFPVTNNQLTTKAREAINDIVREKLKSLLNQK